MNVLKTIFLTETTYATWYELQKDVIRREYWMGNYTDFLQPKQKEEGKGGTMRKSLMFLIMTKNVCEEQETGWKHYVNTMKNEYIYHVLV